MSRLSYPTPRDESIKVSDRINTLRRLLHEYEHEREFLPLLLSQVKTLLDPQAGLASIPCDDWYVELARDVGRIRAAGSYRRALWARVQEWYVIEF